MTPPAFHAPPLDSIDVADPQHTAKYIAHMGEAFCALEDHLFEAIDRAPDADTASANAYMLQGAYNAAHVFGLTGPNLLRMCCLGANATAEKRIAALNSQRTAAPIAPRVTH